MTVQKQALPQSEYDFTEADKQRFAEEHRRGMALPQDPCLCEPSVAIPEDEITSPRIVKLIDRLYTVANAQRRKGIEKQKRRTLVGLAGPQIGVCLRIILIDTKVDEARRHPGKLECLINPVIVWRSREMLEGREGCFSAGPVWGLVRRPVAVKVRAYGPDGKERERVLEGFSARIACHELDHLDGIRFPERITNDKKRHWVRTEELTGYPERAKAWPRLCTRERWEAFKRTAI